METLLGVHVRGDGPNLFHRLVQLRVRLKKLHAQGVIIPLASLAEDGTLAKVRPVILSSLMVKISYRAMMKIPAFKRKILAMVPENQVVGRG